MSISTSINQQLNSGVKVNLNDQNYNSVNSILNSQSGANLYKNANRNLKNNESVRLPIVAAPWKTLQYHQYLVGGMILFVMRTTFTDNNNSYNVASVGQINHLLRKFYLTYMSEQTDIKRFTHKSILDEDNNIKYVMPLSEMDYMDENEPNTLGHFLNEKTAHYLHFVSSKGIWQNVKKLALLVNVSGSVNDYVNAATKRQKRFNSNYLSTIISGVGKGCANYWRGCSDGDYVGFILKRHKFNDGTMPFQFIPWHGPTKQPPMHLMTYIDLNGYNATGYFVPVGRIIYKEQNMATKAFVEELCFGTPQEGFECFASRFTKLN